jgi:hypothetical protein
LQSEIQEVKRQLEAAFEWKERQRAHFEAEKMELTKAKELIELGKVEGKHREETIRSKV